MNTLIFKKNKKPLNLFLSGFEVAVCSSQFAKRFGNLRMSFCIFSKNCESLKLFIEIAI